MNTLARDVTTVLQRCILLHEQQALPLGEAARQTQAEYNRYHAYHLRCIAGGTCATLSFLSWLELEAEYQAVRSPVDGPLDIVQLAALERQLALDVPM